MLNTDTLNLLAQADTVRATNTAIEDTCDTPMVALPAGYTLENLEKHNAVRVRPRGTMQTISLADFTAYVLANQQEGATVFVADAPLSADAILNLGTPAAPGQADDTAKYAPKISPEFAAMLSVNSKSAIKQRDLAEWLEDWQHCIVGLADDDDASEIPARRVVAAIRSVTIEGLRRSQSVDGNLSASLSTLEQVSASSSVAPIPAFIRFTCVPYSDLAQRTFVLRLGVNTSEEKPSFVLRVIAMARHEQNMADELADKVRNALVALPVHLGSYRRGA